jgi:hypothetical protein
MTKKNFTPDIEVLAAIGAWTLHEAQGRPELARDIFNQVLPPIQDHYPHHKLLAHWCQAAGELIDVTPGAASQPSGEDGMTVGELVRRLKLFRPDARIMIEMGEQRAVDVAGITERVIASEPVISIKAAKE